MKKIIKEIYPYIVIIVVVVLFRTFIATPVRVDGDSMNDTLNNKEILILNKLNKNIERFDIVVININNTRIIKRVIGLPGENIEYKNNELYINSKKINDIDTSLTTDFSLKSLYNIDKIPEDSYFVMGDNRGNSLDSRFHEVGIINKKNIVGTTKIRIFPFNKIGKIK